MSRVLSNNVNKGVMQIGNINVDLSNETNVRFMSDNVNEETVKIGNVSLGGSRLSKHKKLKFLLRFEFLELGQFHLIITGCPDEKRIKQRKWSLSVDKHVIPNKAIHENGDLDAKQTITMSWQKLLSLIPGNSVTDSASDSE